MANPGGSNQFGNYTIQPAYGDVQRQTQLTREAPMSGAPLPAQALNAPRRAQKTTQRRPQAAAAAALPPPRPAFQDLNPAAVQQQVWQHLAQVTGDPLIQQYAQSG